MSVPDGKKEDLTVVEVLPKPKRFGVFDDFPLLKEKSSVLPGRQVVERSS